MSGLSSIRAFRLRAVALCLFMWSMSLRASAVFTEQGATILGGVDLISRSASLADIDNDGDLDLFFQGGTGARQMFRNNVIGTSSFTFTNITSSMNITGLGDSWSAAWGDYDGDGRVDVFVGQTNAGTSGDVLRNTGAGFTNTSTAVGLNDPGFHQNVAWSDINNDNRLDLVIGMEGPEEHEIYLQAATGTFTAVGAAAGVQVPFGTKAYGMAIGDTDGDGDMDIYISTCRIGGNIRKNFFENQLVETGILSFVDIADTNGTQFTDNAYGAEFLDFDNDGRLDLFMTGADGEASKIWRNDGGNMFTDVDDITGVPLLSDTGGDLNGSRAVDYDNDGDLDLFFHDNKPLNGKNSARKLYRNDGNWKFVDVTSSQGIAATNEAAYDSTWGDLDRDGDQDLVAPNINGFAERVFVNDASTNGNHWLYVELAGPAGNTTGIGASLYATIAEGTAEERTLRREANTNAGTFNQSDLPVHFGLGAASTINELLIQWPDGSKQALLNVVANQYLTIEYLPGDYNGDSVVDTADYVVWRDGVGTDFTQADFEVWKSHFGQAIGPAVAAVALGGANPAVPEPASGAILVVGIIAALVRRRAMGTD